MRYRSRIADRLLGDALAALGAVVIEGPKACGKTETARRVAASEVLLDLDPQAIEAASVDPRLILEGTTPRLIDEWQRQPRVWDAVRREVDRRGSPGQFILTGSIPRWPPLCWEQPPIDCCGSSIRWDSYSSPWRHATSVSTRPLTTRRCSTIASGPLALIGP